MPPPKNGSLGRGLGDLMGNLPSTIGVAGVPVKSEVRDQKSEVRSQESEIQEIPHGRAKPPAEPSLHQEVVRPMADPVPDSVPVVVVENCWTPARMVMVCVAVLAFLSAGTAIGLWMGNDKSRSLPAEPSAAPSERIIIVTNTITVSPEPVTPAALDATDLQSLATNGLTIMTESNGTLRLLFESPLFSSRVTLDPDQSELMSQVGAVLAAHANEWEVLVTGHTDATPLRNSGGFRDNKELGLARATEVVRFLGRHGVPASMMLASTAGEDHPPFPGDDVDSRRKNRTVTMLIRPASK